MGHRNNRWAQASSCIWRNSDMGKYTSPSTPKDSEASRKGHHTFNHPRIDQLPWSFE